MEHRLIGKRVDNASALLEQSLYQWQSFDSSRLERCLQLLEQSVLEVGEVEKSLRSGRVAAMPDVSSKLALLKTGVAQALRVADAGAAFYRGLAIQFGNPTHAYNSGGQIQNVPTGSLEHEVVG